MKSLVNKTLLRKEIEKAYISKDYRYCAVVINPNSNTWTFITADDKLASEGDDIIFNIDLVKKISYWRKNKYCKTVFVLAVKASEIVTAWLQKLEYEVYGIYTNNDPSLRVELADGEVNSPIVLLNKGMLRNILSYTYELYIYINPITGEWSEDVIPDSVLYHIKLSDYTHYYKANEKRVYEYITLDHKRTNITAAIQKLEMDVLGLQYINGREIRKMTMKG